MSGTRWLGALGLGLFAAHAGRRAVIGHPEHLLWMCHVGALVIATGLLAQAAAPTAIGTQWLVAGVPLWLSDVAAGGELLPTSILTHCGGLVLGLVGLRRLGLPRGAWRTSASALVVLTAVARQVTPVASDVNLGFSALPPGAPWWLAIAVTTLAVAAAAAIFFAIERGLLALGYREANA